MAAASTRPLFRRRLLVGRQFLLVAAEVARPNRILHGQAVCPGFMDRGRIAQVPGGSEQAARAEQVAEGERPVRTQFVRYPLSVRRERKRFAIGVQEEKQPAVVLAA